MLRIASCVDTVQVCSKGWCHHELSSEIMAKKIKHNQSKLLSSGTNIQNSDLYCIQVQQSLFIQGCHNHFA